VRRPRARYPWRAGRPLRGARALPARPLPRTRARSTSGTSTRATAAWPPTREMVRGGLTFLPSLRRWLGPAVESLPVSQPFDYVVHRAGVLSPDEVEAHLIACRDLAAEEAGHAPVDYFGADPLHAPTRLGAAEVRAVYDDRAVAAAFRTQEVGIDPEVLAGLVRRRLAAEPRIRYATISQPSLTGAPSPRLLTQLVERHSAVAFRGLTRLEASGARVGFPATRSRPSRATPPGSRRPHATPSTTGCASPSPQALPRGRRPPPVVAVARRAPCPSLGRPLRRRARAGARDRGRPGGAPHAVAGGGRPRRGKPRLPVLER
jgi:hypothetical protein